MEGFPVRTGLVPVPRERAHAQYGIMPIKFQWLLVERNAILLLLLLLPQPLALALALAPAFLGNPGWSRSSDGSGNCLIIRRLGFTPKGRSVPASDTSALPSCFALAGAHNQGSLFFVYL